MKRLLDVLGLNARIRRARAAVVEASLAAEDRAQLLRMAWDDQKPRLARLTGLIVALGALSVVLVILLSLAVVVHYWDSPHRQTAAWAVAAFWLLMWLAALVALLRTARGASEALAPTQREFSRDWAWMQERLIDEDDPDKPPKAPRPATREALLDRIERQRQRLMLEERMEAAAERAEAETASAAEPASTRAQRLLREHPMASGAAAAVLVAVVGPRRLVRMSRWLVPLLWKL